MSIQVTQLDNGLRVASDRVVGAGTASIGLWLDRGSRHESAAQNGLAHMLEHMVFKGTERRSARQIAEVLENVGGQLNAYTSRETTAYYARVLSEDRALAVDVLTDLATRAQLPIEALEIERQIILSELGELFDTPDDLVFEYFQATAFPDQGLGRSVLGRPDVLKAASAEELQQFYSWLQNPEGLVLVGAGEVEHDLLVEVAACELGHLHRRERRVFPKPVYRGGIQLSERPLEQLHLVMGFEGADLKSDAFYVQSLLATLLGGGTASRLFQELREQRGLAYSLGSFLSAYSDTGLFTIYASISPDDAPQLFEALGQVLDDLASGIQEAELVRARSQLKAAMLMAQESSFTRAETLAGQLLVLGHPVSVQAVSERLDAVSRDALVTALNELRRTPVSLAALGPLHAMPDEAQLRAALERP